MIYQARPALGGRLKRWRQTLNWLSLDPTCDQVLCSALDPDKEEDFESMQVWLECIPCHLQIL